MNADRKQPEKRPQNSFLKEVSIKANQKIKCWPCLRKKHENETKINSEISIKLNGQTQRALERERRRLN